MTSMVLKKHPGIRGLFIVQLFSTLSYSILYSTLVLFITKKLNIVDTQATTITASFIAFNFTLHILGGLISGRLLSHRSLFVIGMISQAVGCVFISFETLSSLYWGLAFFLSGSGLNLICVNCMLTEFFSSDDKTRESAFLWNYSAMNIGFLVGFTLSGIFEIAANYQELFLLSASANILAIIILLFFWRHLFDKKTIFSKYSFTKRQKFRFLGFSIILALIITLRWCINYASFSNKIILLVGIFMFFVISAIAMKQKIKKVSKKIYAFLILAVMATVFWMLYQMMPLGLMLFIENNVNREFLGFIIAPQWVQNINTIIIIIGGPTMAFFYTKLRKKGFKITIPAQFSISLFLIGIGFIILPLGIRYANAQGYVHFGWIFSSYIFQSLGELFISPIGYAMIGQLVPHKFQGIFMGSWLMIAGFAAVLANFFSKLAIGKTLSTNPLETNSAFSQTFNYLGLGAILAGIVMVCLISLIHKLIKEEPQQKGTSAFPQ